MLIIDVTFFTKGQSLVYTERLSQEDKWSSNRMYKDGDELDPGNYRPISLLSNINRVFEKLVYPIWVPQALLYGTYTVRYCR